MEQESGIEIDGERYDIPRLDTITLDEERVLFIYADTVLQDFAPVHPDAKPEEKLAYEALQSRKIRNPDFKRALAHIAYRRWHPESSDTEIEAAIGKVNALEVDIAMLRGGEENPPALSSQNEPEKLSDSSSLSKLTDSGSPTESALDPADVIPLSTGTTASDMSNPGAVPIASAK